MVVGQPNLCANVRITSLGGSYGAGLNPIAEHGPFRGASRKRSGPGPAWYERHTGLRCHFARHASRLYVF